MTEQDRIIYPQITHAPPYADSILEDFEGALCGSYESLAALVDWSMPDAARYDDCRGLAQALLHIFSTIRLIDHRGF